MSEKKRCSALSPEDLTRCEFPQGHGEKEVEIGGVIHEVSHGAPTVNAYWRTELPNDEFVTITLAEDQWSAVSEILRHHPGAEELVKLFEL